MVEEFDMVEKSIKIEQQLLGEFLAIAVVLGDD